MLMDVQDSAKIGIPRCRMHARFHLEPYRTSRKPGICLSYFAKGEALTAVNLENCDLNCRTLQSAACSSETKQLICVDALLMGEIGHEQQ